MKVGYGSAASLIMTLIVLVLAFFYIRQTFKKDEPEKERKTFRVKQRNNTEVLIDAKA